MIKNNSSLPGLEPGIFRFEVERVIHYATGPCDEKYVMTNTFYKSFIRLVIKIVGGNFRVGSRYFGRFKRAKILKSHS